MSLSKTLQSGEILENIKGKSFSYIKEYLTGIGMEWFSKNPQEDQLIRENLTALEIPHNDALVNTIKQNIIFHYAEKILPLSGSPSDYAGFLDSNVDSSEAEELLREASKRGGVLVATPHFGGVELVVPQIARLGHRVNSVMRFSTPELSQKARDFASAMAQGGDFSEIGFIELGKPGVSGAMEMSAVLRRGEVLFTVFDEETDYSIPVDFFGKSVLGGAGLSKLLKFCGASVTVFNVFMIRTGDDTFRMELKEIDLSGDNPVQEMYKNLEKILNSYIEQWYFLHEEVPFA